MSAAIVHNAREQWLLQRRDYVTASDAAAILGLDPYRKPSDVYLAKLGLASEEESWPMTYGTEFQTGVGRAYARDTGRTVRMASLEVPELIVHPDVPFIACTPDGDVTGSEQLPAPADGDGALEIKVSSVAHKWDADELPAQFQIQSTVQQACMKRNWGAVAAFVSLRQAPRGQDIVFDPELFRMMVPRFEEFLDRVKRKTPPTDNVDWWSTASIRRLWSANNGESIVFDAETADVVTAWQNAKVAKKSAEEIEERLGNQIRLRLAGAALGYLPGGCAAVALSNVKETFIAAHKKAAHTRLLWKPKGGK